jgi:Ser/Thr protein kinase RdoA (MazF antagonist)
MKPLTPEDINRAIASFAFKGTLQKIEENHNGHINDTFVLTFVENEKIRHYILQRVNTNVFPRVNVVFNNIDLVLSYMKDKVESAGGDPDLETLTLIPTHTGKFYFKDSRDSFFRAYLYIEGSSSYNQATPEIFRCSGYAFGKFQHDLDGFPTEKLEEVIPHFHDTPKRYADLLSSIDKAVEERKKAAKNEIDWAIANKEIASYLTGKNLPMRVTHNDTKLNNVLFVEDKKIACVIDLDTVMPGLSLYDYGDSIRFGANTCAEDEEDISKIKLDLELFEAYTKGYLQGASGSLTKEEIALFPEAAMTLTYECGIRFLKDYLDGDVYFKIDRPNHNLIRAKDQFALVDDMKKKLPEMRAIVERLSK